MTANVDPRREREAQSSDDRLPPLTRRQLLKGGAVGAAVVAAFGTMFVLDRIETDHRIYGPERKLAGEWLKGEGPDVSPTLLKVDSRVATRKTPSVLNADHHGNGDDNRAGILDEAGTVLVVRNPIMVDGFFGFIDPTDPVDQDDYSDLETDEERAEYIADHTLWVASYVEGDDLIQQYEDPRATSNQLAGKETAKASVTERGTYASPWGGEAASAQIMSKADADFFLQAFQPARS